MILPARPEETALVLGGGGAKGSYEVGVIAALLRLGVEFRHVYGVSVGALNAAMVAQGTPEEADRLWSAIRLTDLVSPESLPLFDSAENAFQHPEKLVDFLARYKKQRGVDVAPLEDLLRSHVDEARLRVSPISFALLATRVSTLSRVEMRLPEIPRGQLIDWMMASAACFPVFPMRTIDGDNYIDGGFCDNVPVSMALADGARHVIAADIGKHRAHTQYDRRPNVTYIRASRPIGGLMTFDAGRAEFNRALGYNDTLRAFGVTRGFAFSFDAEDVEAARPAARDFVAMLSRAEAALTPTRVVDLPARGNGAFFSLLEAEMSCRCEATDYYLRALELVADAAGLDPLTVYTLDSLRDALAPKLPMARAARLADSLASGSIGAVLAGAQPDRLLAIACLMALLARSGFGFPLAAYAAASFPREFVCALTLRFLLGEEVAL